MISLLMTMFLACGEKDEDTSVAEEEEVTEETSEESEESSEESTEEETEEEGEE